MKKIVLFAFLCVSLIACKNKEASTTENITNETVISNERIVSLNGSITEILVDLGQRQNIVGIDVTSSYPTDLNTTATQLEHVNKINIEALLALQPTLVYMLKKDLNETLEKQLKEANIKTIIVDQTFSIDGTKEMIQTVAAPLGLTDYQTLFDKIDNEIKEIKPLANQPKVLFIYARGAANLFVAGENTPIQSIIELAGGENAAKGFSDFKPLTPEALLNSNPDYILLFDTGLQSMGGIDGIMAIEGIQQTNAGKNKKIITMDGLLLSGFTPRIGEAASQLNQKISQ